MLGADYLVLSPSAAWEGEGGILAAGCRDAIGEGVFATAFKVRAHKASEAVLQTSIHVLGESHETFLPE